VDGNGNRTEWQRDAAGRVTREVRGVGAGDIQYVYENTTSRLKQIIDAKGQITNITHDISDECHEHHVYERDDCDARRDLYLRSQL
jgi:hypothetical protein